MPKCKTYSCTGQAPYDVWGYCSACHSKVLAGKPSGCVGCPLEHKGAGFTVGRGSGTSGLVFVGSAPYLEEATVSHTAFTSGYGRTLGAMCAQAGISLAESYATNIIKCCPPEGYEVGPEELRHCLPYFFAEESRIPLKNVYVPLGQTAFLAFTGKSDLGNRRGVKTLGAKDRKVVGTLAPEDSYKQQQLWPLVVWDLIRARQEASSPTLVRVETRYDLYSSAEDLDSVARTERCQRILEDARRAGFVSIDIETTNLDPRTSYVRCIGYGSRVGHAEVHPWTLETQQLCRQILTDPTITKVGQNSEGFDWPFLEYKLEARVAPNTFDTLVAFHLTNSDLPKDLTTIASCYSDQEYWKNDEMYKSDLQGLMLGNAKDVDATTRSYLGLREEIKALGLDKLLYETVMPLQPVLRDMGARGMKRDLIKCMQWGIAYTKVAQRKEAVLRQAVGKPTLNVQSSKEMQKLLYDEMGLPVQWKRERGNRIRPTADKAAIDTLVQMFPENKLLGLIGEIRSAYHTKSTYIDVETDEAGYLHPRFGTSKAANGRLNCWGWNAQNQPTELRELCIPDDDEHVFISIDWSQVEWRIAMVLSGDLNGMEQLENAEDIHKAIASEGFDLVYDKVTKEFRHASKFIVYGLGYGRGVASIAKQLGRPKSWVQGFVDRFFARYPQYTAFRKSLDVEVSKQNCLINPFGRRRWWYTRQITEMYNFPPSSTAGDMMYKAILLADQQLPKGATLRLTVHDELIACAHRDVVKQASECLTDIMNSKWPMINQASRYPQHVKKYYPHGWYCPAEPSYGIRNWRETKDERRQDEFKRELGLL